MRVPLSWLSNYVDLELSASELAHRLTMAGFEVEAIERVGPDCRGVVAALVESRERHPNADRLSLCRVSTGKETFSVVCGAPNVEAGKVYPFAPIGAVVAGAQPIKRSKLRGVESSGMLCSERELGLSDEAAGLMELPAGTVPGTPIERLVGEPDTVLELSITPNRPDCLGLLGVAREVAALTGRELKRPPLTPLTEHEPIGDFLAVDLQAPDGCPRYSARRVAGVRVGPSPEWMQRALRNAGLRPISNVVDVTNFVMLEYGHPMHAFDARFVHGDRIVIRWARPQEKLTTLDGTALDLTAEDLLIADVERGIALAGIMGGENSEIRDDTTDVILEAAYFEPVAIRKSSRRLKLHTDSSHRFERGCDPAATVTILDRAASLLEQCAGGRTARGRLDAYPRPIAPRRVLLWPERVNGLLGTSLSADTVARLLGLLEMPATALPDGSLDVEVPTFRPDVEGGADLAEEVARLHGYGNIAEAPALVAARPVQESPLAVLMCELREGFAGAGLAEAVSTSFAPAGHPDAVILANPLAEENSALRHNLLDGLVGALQFNLQRQNPPPRLFELGRVFSRRPATGQESPFSFAGLPAQPFHAAFVLSGPVGSDWRQGPRAADFHTAKGLVESLARRFGLPLEIRAELPEGHELPASAHVNRRAGIVLGEDCIGHVAELSPEVPFLKRFPVSAAMGELDLERLAAAPRPVASCKTPPAFPKAQRDLAFLLPLEVRYETVDAAIRSAGAGVDDLVTDAAGKTSSRKVAILEAVALFDVFAGKNLPTGKRSVAFSLAFRHPERTLTDAEVDAAVQAIVDRVRAVGGELR